MTHAIAILISSVSVLATLLFGAPLWIAAYPLLFMLPGRATISGVVTMGLLLDLFSGHPFGTVTLSALATALVVLRVERYVERTPFIIWVGGVGSTVFVLLILVVSRILVATAAANNIAAISVFLLVFSPAHLLAVFTVALGAAILSTLIPGNSSRAITPHIPFYA